MGPTYKIGIGTTHNSVWKVVFKFWEKYIKYKAIYEAYIKNV